MGTAPAGGRGTRTGSAFGEIFVSTKDLSGLIRFSPTCIADYRRLFAPEQSVEQVRSSIYQRLMKEGDFSSTQPAWLEEIDGAVGYAVIGDELALRIHSNQGQQPTPFTAVGLSIRSKKKGRKS